MRPSEWLLIAYFTYTSVLALVLDVPASVRVMTPLLNLTLFATYALMVWAYGLRRNPVLGLLRDWFALPMLLLTYREIGWFAQASPGHPLEMRWVVWDRVLLYGGLKAVVESLGTAIPMLLEISYLLVYSLAPLSLVAIYAYRQQKHAERFLFVYVTAVVLCYAQYPLWPSEPPRSVFPGQDLPVYDGIFRQVNLWYLGRQGIHTSVFPSTHVASSFACAFGMWRAMPERRWVYRSLLVMAMLIATATVYGRYHYAADAAAGFTMAVLALAASRRLKYFG